MYIGTISVSERKIVFFIFRINHSIYHAHIVWLRLRLLFLRYFNCTYIYVYTHTLTHIHTYVHYIWKAQFVLLLWYELCKSKWNLWDSYPYPTGIHFFPSSCADRKLSCKYVRLRLYLKTMIHTLKTLNQNIKSL